MATVDPHGSAENIVPPPPVHSTPAEPARPAPPTAVVPTEPVGSQSGSSQYDRVWNNLKWWFTITFALTLLLIAVFSYMMLRVVYKTTDRLEGDEARTAAAEPELAIAKDSANLPPKLIVEDAARIRTSEALALSASLQVSLVMFLGFNCIFYGLLLTCLGITAGYDVKASGASASFSIASSSPGMLFLIGGIVLIGVALFKQLEYQDKTVVPYDLNPPPIQETPAHPEKKQ